MAGATSNQGQKAKALIEFIKARRSAYYNARVTKRWKDATRAIALCLDQRHDPEEQDITRSKIFLSAMVASDDALNETYSDQYRRASPLITFSTKRRGTVDLAERAGWLAANIRDEAEFMDPWLSYMRDINRYGMGIAYQRWDNQAGNAVGMENLNQPWGQLAAVVLQEKTLINRAYSERFHPYHWWGDWKTHLTPRWEGVTRVYNVDDLESMLDDPDYSESGVKNAIDQLKRGAVRASDENYSTEEEDDEGEDVPDDSELLAHEYWGPISGAKGWEDSKGEYQVIVTDTDILMKPRPNAIPGFRPIKRPRGIVINDWACGRPALLPQVAAVKLETFMANAMVDDVFDRLYAGWAMWENALEDPDEFMNPEGIGAPVRMQDDAPNTRIPQKIGQAQSGVIADLGKIMETVIVKDRQSSNFADVMSQRSGIQDGTARAANIIVGQGARKVGAIMSTANATGLLPINEQLILLTLINKSPEELARQTRDGKEFQLSPDEFALMLEKNLWQDGDIFRRDPMMDTLSMERLAKAGAVEYLTQNATNPETPTKFWRAYARTLDVQDFDDYFPLGEKKPAPPQAEGLPAQGAQGGMPPGAPVDIGAPMAQAVAA
jgi:hypothetical protein